MDLVIVPEVEGGDGVAGSDGPAFPAQERRVFEQQGLLVRNDWSRNVTEAWPGTSRRRATSSQKESNRAAFIVPGV